MKTRLILAMMFFMGIQQLTAQRDCAAYTYQQEELRSNPTLAGNYNNIEATTQEYIIRKQELSARLTQGFIVRIPVVVHILYREPSTITNQQVQLQLDILNKAFRRQNADTSKTPSYFRPFAADCEIEFYLATSDPKRRSTNGIIRKYTPISIWEGNDKMKFSSEMGDDAWDPSSYLNIWVCNMERLAGYSSRPGGDPAKDGIVISSNVFGNGSGTGFDLGKTAIHEAGHWLNLKHIWGDDYCGDDGVADTPKQAGYNSGCPGGKQISCDSGPNGDMYMNYMDFTSDACMNMFTNGQKDRMRALFENDGPRNSILYSKGLSDPLIFESPVPVADPTWLHYQVYPNPATSEITADLAYDPRWIGKSLIITNLQGQQMMQVTIASRQQKIDIRKLKPGMYIMSGKKEDGETVQQKFIKL